MQWLSDSSFICSVAARQQAVLAEAVAHLVVHLDLVHLGLHRQRVRGLAVEEQEERPGAQWCPLVPNLDEFMLGKYRDTILLTIQ